MSSVSNTQEFINFVANAEGRDKFGKFIQFFARFLSDAARKFLGNEELGKQFENFWRCMLDARRMQWFGKSLTEWKTVCATLDNKSLSSEVRICHALARFGFCIRWAIENFMILYKINFLTGRKWQDLNKKAKRIWMAAIFCGIASEGFKYRAACDNDDESGKTKSCFNTLAHVGDMAVPLVIGFDFPLSDLVVGLGHMIAAAVQSYNIFQGTKSKPKEKQETDPSSPKVK